MKFIGKSKYNEKNSKKLVLRTERKGKQLINICMYYKQKQPSLNRNWLNWRRVTSPQPGMIWLPSH